MVTHVPSGLRTLWSDGMHGDPYADDNLPNNTLDILCDAFFNNFTDDAWNNFSFVNTSFEILCNLTLPNITESLSPSTSPTASPTASPTINPFAPTTPGGGDGGGGISSTVIAIVSVLAAAAVALGVVAASCTEHKKREDARFDIFAERRKFETNIATGLGFKFNEDAPEGTVLTNIGHRLWDTHKDMPNAKEYLNADHSEYCRQILQDTKVWAKEKWEKKYLCGNRNHHLQLVKDYIAQHEEQIYQFISTDWLRKAALEETSGNSKSQDENPNEGIQLSAVHGTVLGGEGSAARDAEQPPVFDEKAQEEEHEEEEEGQQEQERSWIRSMMSW